jgi:hypothetical protein
MQVTATRGAYFGIKEICHAVLLYRTNGIKARILVYAKKKTLILPFIPNKPVTQLALTTSTSKSVAGNFRSDKASSLSGDTTGQLARERRSAPPDCRNSDTFECPSYRRNPSAVIRSWIATVLKT